MMVINEITILVWIVCGIGSFLIAQSRGATNAPTWFLVGVLLGPIGIILAAIAAKGPASGGVAALGAADEISKLTALRDAGSITGEEFDRQKGSLLAQPAVNPATPALTGTARTVFYGFIAFLVVLLVWLLLQVM